MKREKRKKQSVIVIPKGYTIDDLLDMENDYADEEAIREEEVEIRFER